MMPQEITQLDQNKSLDYYILFYLYHNLNVPFNVKTVLFIMKGMKYQKNYLAMTLSKLSKWRFLAEPELGIYVMTKESYQVVKSENPTLAKEIKSKLKYQKIAN